MDESAFYLLPSVVRTWSKLGISLVIRPSGKKRLHLSVASAISLEGHLITQKQRTSFTGKDMVSFLKHLLSHVQGNVILIWDGASIHRGEAVKSFLATKLGKRLRLIRLPPYAPELNPDECVWGWLKRRLGNVCCQTIESLEEELVRAIAALRRRPKLIQSFFKKVGLEN
jgi:transposase